LEELPDIEDAGQAVDITEHIAVFADVVLIPH